MLDWTSLSAAWLATLALLLLAAGKGCIRREAPLDPFGPGPDPDLPALDRDPGSKPIIFFQETNGESPSDSACGIARTLEAGPPAALETRSRHPALAPERHLPNPLIRLP
jgi:hypothetical protein